MIALYGQPFVNRNGLQDKGLWLDVLCELTPKALESGMQRLKDLTAQGKFLDFAPNCLQFKAICMAYYENLGLPKSYEALQEIKNNRDNKTHLWSHPVVEFMVNRLPSDFFRIESEQEAERLFKTLYKDVTDLIKQGHPIPPVKPKPAPVPFSPTSSGKSHLEQLHQLLRG